MSQLVHCLRMIRSSDVVADPMLQQVLSESLINEVRSSITYHHPWYSKPWKYYFFKHLDRALVIRSSTWQGLNPLGNIINCHQDVLIIAGFWKWSHEINSPDIEELDLEIGCQGHGIFCVDVAVLLTCSTSSDKIFGVLIHGWPEKSALPDLCMCPAECSIMTSIG